MTKKNYGQKFYIFIFCPKYIDKKLTEILHKIYTHIATLWNSVKYASSILVAHPQFGSKRFFYTEGAFFEEFKFPTGWKVVADAWEGFQNIEKSQHNCGKAFQGVGKSYRNCGNVFQGVEK